MGKKTSQKNADLLLVQQRQELDKLRESMPAELLRAAEDRLLTKCLDIVECSLDFDKLGFTTDGQVDEDNLPFEWGLLSPNEKARKIRLAKYNCLPSKDVPHGVKAAHETLIGIIKARAQEASGTRVLNLEVSQFPAPAPLKQAEESIDAEFEVIDIE
jgi:hypothetical protein